MIVAEKYTLTMTMHTGESIGVMIDDRDPVYPEYTVHYANGTTEDAEEIFDDDDWTKCLKLEKETKEEHQ